MLQRELEQSVACAVLLGHTDEVGGVVATLRLTVSEAIVRYLIAQHIEDDRDGVVKPLIPGVYAIFGHGNALSLGEALEKHRDSIRTIRGQNEEGMALAAVEIGRAHV